MDDYGLRPTAPLVDRSVEPSQDELATQHDKEVSKAFFHPAWVEVEKMFLEAIELCSQSVDPKLAADEYKIEGISNTKVKAKLTEILQRVKDAVQAVESTEPRRVRPKGGK